MKYKLIALSFLLLVGCSDIFDEQEFDVIDNDHCMVTCVGDYYEQ